MGAEIDRLEVQVEAQASKANTQLDKLIGKLGTLSGSIDRINSGLHGTSTINNRINALSSSLNVFSTQGNNVGRSSNTIVNGLNRTSSAMARTRKSSISLAAAFGKFYASWWLVVRGINKLWSSTKNSMNYIETLNYFDAAFGQVADSAVSQWEDAGYDSADAYYESFSSRAKELTSKMTGFNVNDDGTLTATGNASLGINPTKLMNYQATFAQMSSSIGVTAETSLMLSQALTEIGADLASVKNMDFDKVWKDMASGLAGMSRTMDKYGVNIRNVNLQQKLLDLGINENITNLNQNEKALLRAIILLDSTRYAWGDLADTLNQPANQLRLLDSNFNNLARTIGNLFLPAVSTLLPYINGLVISLQRMFTWAGSIMGIDISGITSSIGSSSVDLGDLFENADGASDALGSAAENAKKLKTATLGIDELNINAPKEDTVSGLGISGGISSDILDEAFKQSFEEYQKVWDDAFDNIENRANEFADKLCSYFERGDYEGIGSSISNGISSVLESINWESVYGGASDFGSGFAQFLNGLITPRLFGDVGTTIAGALNTAIYASLSFGEEFDFYNLGDSIAEGINKFFENFDFKALAKTLNVWATGAYNTVKTAIGNIKWSTVWNGVKDFLSELDVDTVAIIVGGFSLMHAGKYLTGTVLKGIINEKFSQLFTSAFGTGALAGVQAVAAAFAVGATIYVSFKFAEDSKKWLESIKQYGWGEGRKKIRDEKGAANPHSDERYQQWEQDWAKIEERLNSIKSKADELINGISESVSTLFEENIQPWFTVEKWCEFGQGILDGIGLKWEEFKLWWQESALYLWWEDDVSPWFSIDKWYETADGIKKGISDKWSDTVNKWKTDVNEWWDKHVSPWFKEEKWNDIMSNIPNAFSKVFKNAANNAIEIFNRLIDWINEKMHFEWDAISIAGQEIVPSGSVQLFTIPRIPRFELGGFPETGELFMARENGINEMVGRIGSHNAVANNDQIVEAVSIGVSKGVADAVEHALAPYLSQIAQNTRETADKDMEVNIGDRDIFRASERGRRSAGLRLRVQ